MKSDNNIDIFFLGDTYFGEWHMHLRSKKGKSNILEEKGYTHFGKHFEKLLQNGDEVIINLECAITDIKKSPLEGTSKEHLYSAMEENTIKALKKLNVTTAMLANNHSVDFGKAGLIDTIEALEDANIKYIGGGRNALEASQPLIFEKKIKNKSFQVAIVSSYNYGKTSEELGFYAKENIPGVNEQNLKNIKNQIEELKKENPNIFYILSPHWGPNYVWRTFTQKKQAEELVNIGVDLIVGHSAHMIQEIEYYKNKLVVYSIGNFILNGDGEYKRRNLPGYSFIARLSINSETLQKNMMLYPFVSDNSATDFTPRFVTEREFQQVVMITKSTQYDMFEYEKILHLHKDEYGFYLEFIL